MERRGTEFGEDGLVELDFFGLKGGLEEALDGDFALFDGFGFVASEPGVAGELGEFDGGEDFGELFLELLDFAVSDIDLMWGEKDTFCLIL